MSHTNLDDLPGSHKFIAPLGTYPFFSLPSRPQLFTLFHPTMSGAKLRLICLAWPDLDHSPEDNIVGVEIDDDKAVTFLRKMKNEYAPSLDKISARDLALWKSSIPVDDSLQKNLGAVTFNGTHPGLDHLYPTSLLSEHFESGLSPKNHSHPCRSTHACWGLWARSSWRASWISEGVFFDVFFNGQLIW